MRRDQFIAAKRAAYANAEPRGRVAEQHRRRHVRRGQPERARRHPGRRPRARACATTCCSRQRANGWIVVGYSLRPGSRATSRARPTTILVARCCSRACCSPAARAGGWGPTRRRSSCSGETLAARAARVLAEVCDPVIEVGPGVSGLPAVQRGSARRGTARRVARGVGALGNPAPVLLLACDLPFVDAPVLRLLAEWPGTGTVIPVVDGRFAVRVRAVRRGRARRGGRRAAVGRHVAARHRGRRLRRTSPRTSGATSRPRTSFADVDTPDDLRRLGLA